MLLKSGLFDGGLVGGCCDQEMLYFMLSCRSQDHIRRSMPLPLVVTGTIVLHVELSVPTLPSGKDFSGLPGPTALIT